MITEKLSISSKHIADAIACDKQNIGLAAHHCVLAQAASDKFGHACTCGITTVGWYNGQKWRLGKRARKVVKMFDSGEFDKLKPCTVLLYREE